MRLVLLILVLPLGAALAVAAGGRFSNWIDPPPVALSVPLSPLYIADGQDDLGEVWETNDALLTVPISNRTDKDIEILDFETSCDCGEILPRQLVVPARGTAEVKVKMDLTKRMPQQTAMIKRKVTLQFKPLLAGKSDPIRLRYL